MVAHLLALAGNNACRTVHLPLLMVYVVLNKFYDSGGFIADPNYKGILP